MEEVLLELFHRPLDCFLGMLRHYLWRLVTNDDERRLDGDREFRARNSLFQVFNVLVEFCLRKGRAIQRRRKGNADRHLSGCRLNYN
jgi:hypothetical protein